MVAGGGIRGCVIVLCLGGGVSAWAFARGGLDESTLDFFAQNNIFYYDPNACEENTNCVMPTGGQITWIGDSYSVEARSEIEEKFPGISFGDSIDDASSTIQGCKFVASSTTCNANPTNPSGLDVLQRVIDAGDLKQYLVFALGGNGGWQQSYLDRFEQIRRASCRERV